MSNLKKALCLVLVIALTAGLAITGTLAYLTDRDSKANVFTVGDVSVELNEEFEQGSSLVPGVKIEKEATITNTGKNDAYVWMTVAMPKQFVGESAAENMIHWNIPGAFWNGYHENQSYIDKAIANGYLPEGSTGVDENDTWMVSVVDTYDVTIDGVEYLVTPVLYTGAIVPGETTNLGISTIYLDARVDIDPDGNMYKVVDGEATEIEWNINEDGAPVVYVSAYAIQAEGFDTVEEAYEAYGTQWGNNGSEYGEKATVVYNVDDLKAALVDGKDVVMTSDVEATAPITVNGSTLSGGGNTLDSDYTGTSGWGQYAIVVNSGTVENITVVDAFRGIGSTNTSGDVYIKNVTIDNVTYAINGNGTGIENVYVSDSTIYGWNSYADIASINFDNCTLGKGNSYDGYMVIYGTTNYTDCVFEDGYSMCGDLRGNLDATVTFTNCTYNSQKVTAENFKTLFMESGDETDFNKLASYKIVIDGVEVKFN